jgi:hypothetical protein
VVDGVVVDGVVVDGVAIVGTLGDHVVLDASLRRWHRIVVWLEFG